MEMVLLQVILAKRSIAGEGGVVFVVSTVCIVHSNIIDRA